MNQSEMETNSAGRLRKLAAKFSNLSRPDGSAILAQGETVVQAGVYGPVEVKQMRENPEKATVEVFFRSKSGQQSCSDRMSEKVIRNTLETAMLTALHPRSCISLTCQEFHNSGGLLAESPDGNKIIVVCVQPTQLTAVNELLSPHDSSLCLAVKQPNYETAPSKWKPKLLACAINAACLAAIDAAVSMKCHIAAVTAAITNTGIIVLDPDGQQEQEARAVCTFSFESQDSKLVSTYTSGQFSKEEFQRCLLLCQAAAGDIFAFYQDALQKRYCLSLGDSDSED